MKPNIDSVFIRTALKALKDNIPNMTIDQKHYLADILVGLCYSYAPGTFLRKQEEVE